MNSILQPLDEFFNKATHDWLPLVILEGLHFTKDLPLILHYSCNFRMHIGASVLDDLPSPATAYHEWCRNAWLLSGSCSHRNLSSPSATSANNIWYRAALHISLLYGVNFSVSMAISIYYRVHDIISSQYIRLLMRRGDLVMNSSGG